MAVQASAPGPTGEVQQAAPAVGGFSIGGTIRQMRRFPVLPLVILVVLLVVPAIFANLIAPHDQIVGDLERELEPPGWVRDRHSELVIVNRASATPPATWRTVWALS